VDSAIIKRIVHGIGANAYAQLVVVIIQLAGVPILLHTWGIRLYGEWLILFAIPSYLSMTDLGFSQSAANDMTARVARGDYVGALEVFQSLTVLVYGVVIVGLGISALLLTTLPLGNWIHFHALPINHVRWILWLLAAEVLIKLGEGPNNAGFRSGGEYGLNSIFYASTLLAQNVGVWLSAVLGIGPLGAAVCFASVRLIATPMMSVVLVRRHRFLEFGLEHVHLADLRNLIKPSLANITMPLAQALNIQGMLLVVGAVMGPVAVVTFSVLRTLTRLVSQVTSAVLHSFEPELARAWGMHDPSLLKSLYQGSLRAGFWLVLSVVPVLYILGAWIVKKWTNGKILMDPMLFDWLLLSSAVTIVWYSGLILLKSVNLHLRVSIWYLISSILTVAVAFGMLHATGRLEIAGLALLITDGIMIAITVPQAKKLSGLSFRVILLEILDVRILLRSYFSWCRNNKN
jgi:O-antigen/teichoic acid export membrane protein